MFLMIAGRPARLLDWSFGGLGIRPAVKDAGLLPGHRVDVAMLRPDGHSWQCFPVIIRHVAPGDAGIVGVELLDRISAFPQLLELLDHSLLPAA